MARTEKSAYIAAYVAEMGVPLRTAQYRFKNNHPSVLDWMVKTGVKFHDAKKSPSPVAAMACVDRLDPSGAPTAFAKALGGEESPEPPALKKNPENRTMEEHAECETWLMFVANTAATRAAAKANDITAAGFARTAVECFKAFQAARNDRIKADIEARRLLPVAEYEALRSDVTKIVTAWVSLGPHLASEIDPANPSRVLRVFERWQQDTLNPIIHSMLAA